eukprot:superscaffoldBa00002540_g14585
MHLKTAGSIFILWAFFFITCGPVQGWLQLWEETPPPKDNAGLTEPQKKRYSTRSHQRTRGAPQGPEPQKKRYNARNRRRRRGAPQGP